MAVEIVKRGYCVNDTVYSQVLKHEIVWKDTLIRRTQELPPGKWPSLDTVLGDRTRIQIKNNVLDVVIPTPVAQTVKTIQTTAYIQDHALENLLRQEAARVDITLKEVRENLVLSEKVRTNLQKSLLWNQIAFYAVLVIIVLLLIFGIVKRLKTFT
jgi:hypothetical protein